MGFKFSLLAVLDHRVTLEEKAQREYGDAQAKLERIRQQQREAEDEIARYVDIVRRNQHDGSGLAMRDVYENWIVGQRYNLQRLQVEADRQAAEVEQLRLKLVRAVQDRTIMERLRERELADFRQEEARAELRQFDEIAVRNFIMARRQEKDAASQERIAG